MSIECKRSPIFCYILKKKLRDGCHAKIGWSRVTSMAGYQKWQATRTRRIWLKATYVRGFLNWWQWWGISIYHCQEVEERLLILERKGSRIANVYLVVLKQWVYTRYISKDGWMWYTSCAIYNNWIVIMYCLYWFYSTSLESSSIL